MSKVYQVHDTLTGLPHPAGLGLLIVVIIIFFLILIPATSRGETRLLLLFDVLLGRKQVNEQHVTAPPKKAASTAPTAPVSPAPVPVPVPTPTAPAAINTGPTVSDLSALLSIPESLLGAY